MGKTVLSKQLLNSNSIKKLIHKLIKHPLVVKYVMYWNMEVV